MFIIGLLMLLFGLRNHIVKKDEEAIVLMDSGITIMITDMILVIVCMFIVLIG